MNIKQIFGLVVLALGVVLLIFGSQSQHKLDDNAASYRGMNQLIPSTFLQKKIGHKIDRTVDEYQKEIYLCYAAGIALVAVGIGLAVYFKERR